ncbi:MAG TPA: DUF2939 domain-containing protein [Caulobacteraceae bacterium]|nr:DUF2939 domain-containing protein [Caulobacteraceae bacterium]
MRRLGRALAVCALAMLAACATGERISAAGDVHTLMVAIRDDDRASFEAHVDRHALEAQIQARIVERTSRSNEAMKGLGALFSGTLARVAGGLAIRPEVFRAVAEYYGYRPGMPIPGTFAIAAALRPVPGGRVCAVSSRQGPCLVTFAREGGVWRLVSFDGDPAMLRLR